jgi:hypothetical protein
MYFLYKTIVLTGVYQQKHGRFPLGPHVFASPEMYRPKARVPEVAGTEGVTIPGKCSTNGALSI